MRLAPQGHGNDKGEVNRASGDALQIQGRTLIMRPFESASGATIAQSSALTRHTGARRASSAALILCAGFLASVVLSSTAFGQQSQGSSRQFRKRSTESAAGSSAIDSKLKGFLEQQAGIEQTHQVEPPEQIQQTQQRTTRTQVRSGDSSSNESHRATQPSSSAFRSSHSATSVNGSREPDQTEGREISQDSDQSLPAIKQAAWEPKSEAISDGSAASGGSLAGLRQSEAISELQPTPSIAADQKPAEISVPLQPSADAGMFLDLRADAKIKNASAPIGERGAEVAIETSPVQVLSRAVAWIVIALCLFSLAALGVRRWQRQRGLLPTPGSRSRVIETLSLGPGRSVSLIEMAGHRALVAFDAGGIKQLVLTPPSFQDELTEADEPLSYERPAKTRPEATVIASESLT
jgi:flagellar biogenesis protein FliO